MMEEVRQLVQEEGREARNLVAFHVAVDTPARVARKPPRAGAPPPRRVAPRSAARLRSASAGRDKRSELRARYWALLFGDLQRAVGEIYNTVEAHENLNECQEVILVLENYTRDFKSLGEWFRLKWEYDNTPPPQRPQSLAWEIRKTDFVRPESRRTHSVKSSPSVSGKNSPSLSGHNTPSGKNSPNLTGKSSPGSGKISPRIPGSSTSPKGSVEFFSNKIASKIATKPEPKVPKEPRLSDIKEKDVPPTEDFKIEAKVELPKKKDEKELPKAIVEFGRAKETPNAIPKPVVVKTPKRKPPTEDNNITHDNELSDQAKATINKLDAMENEFLAKHLIENVAKNDNLLNHDKEEDKKKHSEELPTSDESATVDSNDKYSVSTESPVQSEDNFGDISNESSKSSEKASLEVVNTDESKLSTESIISENNEIKINIVKKTEVAAVKKKDSIINAVKEMPSNDTKHVNANENDVKKESNKKTPKEAVTKDPLKKDNTKPELLKKDGANDLNVKAENVGTEPKNNDSIKKSKPELESTTKEQENDIQSDGIIVILQHNSITEDEHKTDINKNIKEIVTQNVKKEDEKPANVNSSEPNLDAKDGKKEDRDFKKVESKAADTKAPARPAYSQAAAKPKIVTKAEVKTPTKTALYRSKTVVEIRPNIPNRQMRQNANRNPKNKCSYPFNLTTGRTSLFDAPGNKVVATKKPISRSQLASGDTRNQIKPDLKTRPPRPVSLKINEQGDKQDKINPAFEKMKDCDEYSSSDTVVTQIDISRIESSESLKTIVPDGFEVGNSIEVLNVDGDKNDNDGWLTVKSRRLSRESKKSKSLWANRFHQPSATTSLPTLNMIESPKSETNPVVDAKLDRAKSEQPQNKPEKTVKVAAKKEPKIKNISMIRQKSDVTGLKTRSSRNKALKREKNKDKKDSELTKNRLHSSLESLTTGLARSQESTEDDAFDFDKWKAKFVTTFKYLEEDDQMTNDNEILKTADPSEMSEIAEMTSQIEENERKISLALDFQSEVDQKKLCQEEDLLNRQIMELQQVSDIELDTETDDTETDAEILCEDSAIVTCQTDNLSCISNLTSCLEHHYESALEGMSWAERVDMLGALEALVARDPGRAQQLHAKLSAGMKRRGSLQDVLRRLQAKQARAEKQRMRLHTERAKKIHQLLARVEEVKMAKNQLIDEKRMRMERRLQKAAENRDQHLKDIVRKAHDEEEKLREIAFIKQLEAENRRHEFLEQCRTFTSRLREMRRERLDKLEQKAAREAAVGARRQALEAARKQHVESLLEKRKERDARVEELKEQKKQERDDAAREKAEGLKSRLSALAAAAELEAESLRSRIRDKQDASQMRLESHLQAIREKATGPRIPTTSESQEQNGRESTKEEEEEAAKIEQERREREKQKVLRKKARKLKQKILATCQVSKTTEYPILSISQGKLYRVASQLSFLLAPLLDLQVDAKLIDDDNDSRKRRRAQELVDDNVDFRYDFEDKLGKKKKKKKAAQEKDKNSQSNEQKSKKTNEEKKNKNIQKTNKENEKNDLKNDTQNSKNDTQNDNVDLKNDLQTDILTNDKKKKSDQETQNAQKNKNDAQKSKNDAQKLSKSNSICSSISDMSKVSGKVEKPMLSLDITAVEKLIGDLYRLATSKDCQYNTKSKPKLPDMAVFSKLHAVKALGHLISILAEREDLLSQISVKSLTMCVVCTIRIMNSSAATALYYCTAPALLHTVSLLHYQLGRDLSDHKELELAKQLADLVSISLDAPLCESRLRDCAGEVVASARARAHNIISYLCLSGCIARAEAAAGEARERVQTLVTICASLCQSHVADAGPERASALQSLRCALGTSLMGSRAEFCLLFAEGAELSRSQNFVRAARTAHLLRQLAELDHLIVQDAFGEGRWPLEFRAAVARLLSQHAPNDKEAPTSDSLHLSNQRLDLSLSEQMVLDLIVLVGYVVVNNPVLHETICENWGVIKTLCTLPANWLVSASHCHSLLPTLVVLAQRPDTARVICSELSIKMLDSYINSADGRKVKLIQILKAAQDKAKKPNKKDKTQDKEGDKKDIPQEKVNANVNKAIANGDVTDKDKAKNDSDTESLDEEV